MPQLAQVAPRITTKRRQTQDRILAAFNTVLCRDGLAAVGVNSVVKEAGVGKGLIYDYFGGFDGLIAAWAEQQAANSPTAASLEVSPDAGSDPTRRLAQVHSNYATMIKDNPVLNALMAEELHQPSSLTGPFKALRLQIGAAHEAVLTADDTYNNNTDMALIFVLQAACNYLALRANSAPSYNGLELDTAAGWEQMMAMLETVAGLRSGSGH